jgi:hypothetical protein
VAQSNLVNPNQRFAADSYLYPSNSSLKSPIANDPNKSITENDDLHSLADLLASNIGVKKQQQRENKDTVKNIDGLERLNKISLNSNANVIANVSKNEAKLKS